MESLDSYSFEVLVKEPCIEFYNIVNSFIIQQFDISNFCSKTLALASSNAFIAVVLLAFLVTVYVWVASIITGNVSQVDRLWSIVPFVYVFLFVVHDDKSFASSFSSLLNIVQFFNDSKRLLIVFIGPFIWGFRLTYNFARKGGYSGNEEDYRWPIIRKKINNVILFQIFNLAFIAIYQMYLLLSISLPAYFMHVSVRRFNNTAITNFDLLVVGLFFLFLFGETIADNQQWHYYNKRTAYRKNKNNNNKIKDKDGDLERGFLSSTGLFRFCRHPNFFCEQSMWWTFYLWSLSATSSLPLDSYTILNNSATSATSTVLCTFIDKLSLFLCNFNFTLFDGGITIVLFNWTLLGAIQLSLLFQGSTAFTEDITLSKYPTYKMYQQTTSRLMPFIPGPKISSVLKKQI